MVNVKNFKYTVNEKSIEFFNCSFTKSEGCTPCSEFAEYGEFYGFNWEPEHITIIEKVENMKNVKPEFYKQIKRVLVKNPAIIVFWKDGTKTVSRCREGDVFDIKTGLSVAITKKLFNTQKEFNSLISKLERKGEINIK